MGVRGEPGRDGSDLDLGPVFDDMKEKFLTMQNNMQIQINNALSRMSVAAAYGASGGSAGGGSVNILQQDDVVFARPQDVANNSVLVFDQSLNKFNTVSLNSLVDAILAATKYTKLIDKAGDLTYIGEADPGTAESSATWRIARVDETLDPDLQITWADGTADFIKVWDDRATYTYS